MTRRLIAHLDMDAFFASVELLRYPDLRGRPVVIGGERRRHQPLPQADGSRRYAVLRDYVGRGVVTTATYEARTFGVHSGMGLMKAAALAPEAVLLPIDFEEYRRYSRLFKAAVAEVAPVIEDRGIDEIFIDLTDEPGAQDAVAGDPLGGVRALARRIKDSVRRATGLSCSIGVTPNKLLSKLCSDLEKPDGLTVLMPEDMPARLWQLPVGRINGIGPKAQIKLESLGIRSIGELAAADAQSLIDRFGASYGLWLHEAAHGIDDRPVVTHREPKSLSRETTFERDLHPRQDREQLGTLFTRLCEQVAADLTRKGYVGKTVGLKLRYEDFRTVTRDITLGDYTDDAATIRQAAGRCLKRVPLEKRLRLLGVRVSALCRKGEQPETPRRPPPGAEKGPYTLPLFDDV